MKLHNRDTIRMAIRGELASHSCLCCIGNGLADKAFEKFAQFADYLSFIDFDVVALSSAWRQSLSVSVF